MAPLCYPPKKPAFIFPSLYSSTSIDGIQLDMTLFNNNWMDMPTANKLLARNVFLSASLHVNMTLWEYVCYNHFTCYIQYHHVDYQISYGFSDDGLCELDIANKECHTFAKYEGRSIHYPENEDAGKQCLTVV